MALYDLRAWPLRVDPDMHQLGDPIEDPADLALSAGSGGPREHPPDQQDAGQG